MPVIPLTLRLLKGSKLTFSELDQNFIQLRNAINNISNTNTFVTGGTYNNLTTSLDFTGNNGFNPFSVDVVGLTDTYVSGGIYDPVTGCVTFTTTSGYTFDVCGFLTGTTLWINGSAGAYSLKAINDSGLDATGDYALAEGYITLASGFASHAEGRQTQATGIASHAEGRQTQATGITSHAEGYLTKAHGNYSHAEGGASRASGLYSHSEGSGTIASGVVSHAEGLVTKALGDYSHSEGQNTTAGGGVSHAEGSNTIASGYTSHAEGYYTKALGDYSHAEGEFTIASGDYSHAQGNLTTASGLVSHSEGINTTASGIASHAEGTQTTADGIASHAEGGETKALGDYSHAGGYNSVVSGQTSFIHSTNSILIGDRSVVLGGQNITGTTNDTVYVPYLNINSLETGSSINNLGIDSNGFVVAGSADTNIANTDLALTLNRSLDMNGWFFGMYDSAGLDGFGPTISFEGALAAEPKLSLGHGYYINPTSNNTILDIGVKNGKTGFTFSTNSVEKVIIDINGDVGIGTTSPSEKLEVSGKTKTTNFQMTAGATNGYVLTSDVSGNASWQASSGGGSIAPITISWDGQGGFITTGLTRYFVVPYNCNITGWSIVAEGTNPTCTIDVWGITSGTSLPTVVDTITASAPPNLSTGNVVRSSNLTGWSTSLSAGDILGFNIDATSNALTIKINIEL